MFVCHNDCKTLFLTCTESIPNYPNHPVLKVGVTVQIGLDKPVKLSEVFKRYVEFCNEECLSQTVDASDLEFFHTQLLNGHDTAEVAALMKNDRISVRREQSNERLDEEAWNKLQREIDQPYFRQLRDMLPNAQDTSTSIHDFADVVLDCRRVLHPHTTSTIKCHSIMICKRCPWLNRLIAAAREELSRRSVVTVQGGRPMDVDDDDEERNFDMMQHVEVEPRRDASAAAEIENDDEDITEVKNLEHRPANSSDLLYIEIKDHPPEAMKILLEYCYTNRVENLGFEAFMHSCRTKPQYKKMQGPVPPFSLRRWPNSGEPTIMFDVALAGIRLAEEVNLPRLSLMCEIAAAQLVDHAHAVEALAACEEQRILTGNPLPRLRKASMEIVLVSYHSFDDNVTTSFLKSALSEKGSLLIPTLITGTMEAIEAGEKRMRHLNVNAMCSPEKRDWKVTARRHFDKIDKIDAIERDRERRKRRAGNDFIDEYTDPIEDRYMQNVASGSTVFDDDGLFSFWGESGRHVSLKRMHAHITSSSLGNRLAARRTGTLNNHLVVTNQRNNAPTQRRELR